MIKSYIAPELFAATQPIESLKYLLRTEAQGRALSIVHGDMARGYFYANAGRNIYVRLPAEDPHERDAYMCGELRKAMYGTRVVAQNWQRKFSGTVRELGFVTRSASPCHLVFVGRGETIAILAQASSVRDPT